MSSDSLWLNVFWTAMLAPYELRVYDTSDGFLLTAILPIYGITFFGFYL